MHRPVTLTLHPRRIVVAAGTLLAGAALAACASFSPTQTNVPYLQSDGVPANVGPIEARNLLVVAQSTGATGVLSGSIINSGSSPASVTFLTVADSQGSSANGTTLQLGPHQQQVITGVQFTDLKASPGALTGIVLKTTAGLLNVQVPVLLPTGIYSTITATAGPSTATTAATTGSATTATTTTGSATSGTATGTATTTGSATSVGTATTSTTG
ncbi:MAG: hypothetical protein ABIW80_06930 [Lapillicoccus sp.]